MRRLKADVVALAVAGVSAPVPAHVVLLSTELLVTGAMCLALVVAMSHVLVLIRRVARQVGVRVTEGVR